MKSGHGPWGPQIHFNNLAGHGPGHLDEPAILRFDNCASAKGASGERSQVDVVPWIPWMGMGCFFFFFLGGGEIKIIMAKHGKTLIYDDLVRFMVIL